MKKIMILGAGVYQLPLIKKARDLQLHTIVVSPRGPYPGIPYADEFIEADTTDIENVLAHARRIDIDAVLTTGTDVAVPTIGKIVEELGLWGTPYGPSLISMDKTLMKKCLVDNNIPTARYFEFLSNETLNAQKAAEEIGYPVMVKASDSSGSRGVIKVNESCNLAAAFSTAAAHTRNNKVIVEQFLDGHEIGAQAVVIGDRVQAIYVHNDTVSAPPTNTPVGHSIPCSLSDSLIERVKKVTELAIKSVGITDTIVNVDLMIVDEMPFIIELGARMGATCLPENISTFCDYDVYELLLNISMGSAVLNEPAKMQPNASLLLTSERTGTIKSITVPEYVKNDSDLVQLNIDVKPGDYVRTFKVGPDRLGDVVVKGVSAEVAEKKARQLASEIIFEVN